MAKFGAARGVPAAGQKKTASRRSGSGRMNQGAELSDTQKQVSQFPVRHCERNEAIQGPQYDRLGCARMLRPLDCFVAGLLAMTDRSPLTRSIR
jgi:hypothetical protein